MNRFSVSAIALLVGLGLSTTGCSAFFDKTDRTEAYTILPNQTAFWVPDVGANKDAQVKLDSEDYYNANKVASKRFVIPHQKLQGSAGNGLFSGWDFYVPIGRLYITDRTTFSHEWTNDTDRGSSKAKEGIQCQSKEGINVTVGISVGASVSEENAAKFLYNFGTIAPQGEATDPNVIFQSVYYSRSVANVMNDVGRRYISTIFCSDVSTRTLTDANDHQKDIMDGVAKKAKDYFTSVGITLSFIGYSDTWTFEPEIQAAINRTFIASQDQKNAALLQPYVATIQALATAEAVRSFGYHTDGKFPTTIVGLPSNVTELMGSLLGIKNIAPTAGGK